MFIYMFWFISGQDCFRRQTRTILLSINSVYIFILETRSGTHSMVPIQWVYINIIRFCPEKAYSNRPCVIVILTNQIQARNSFLYKYECIGLTVCQFAALSSLYFNSRIYLLVVYQWFNFMIREFRGQTLVVNNK